MTWTNPSRETIATAFQKTKRIAVVGISPKPDRPSYGVSKYLQRYFTIVPVNPQLTSWEGIPAYANLTEIPPTERPDMVVVFRRSVDAGVVVDEARSLRIPFIWLQEGIIDEAAGARAQSAGALVVMDACAAVVHRQIA